MRKVGLAVLAYPVAEVLVAVLVAQLIGWFGVLVAFVIGAIVGLVIARLAAQATGRSWSAAMAALRRSPAHDQAAPGRELPSQPSAGIDQPGSQPMPARTVLLVPAGILIAIPGFLTDVAGLVLLLPPVRAAIARRWEAAMRRAGGAGNPPTGFA